MSTPIISERKWFRLNDTSANLYETLKEIHRFTYEALKCGYVWETLAIERRNRRDESRDAGDLAVIIENAIADSFILKWTFLFTDKDNDKHRWRKLVDKGYVDQIDSLLDAAIPDECRERIREQYSTLNVHNIRTAAQNDLQRLVVTMGALRDKYIAHRDQDISHVSEPDSVAIVVLEAWWDRVFCSLVGIDEMMGIQTTLSTADLRREVRQELPQVGALWARAS